MAKIKNSTFQSHAISTTQTSHSTRNTPHHIHTNPTNPQSSTAPSANQSSESPSAISIPIARSWNQPCTKPSAYKESNQPQNRFTAMSRWVFEPPCEQPWNAIGSVPALPVGSGTAELLRKGDKYRGKDSVYAIKGSASSEWRK